MSEIKITVDGEEVKLSKETTENLRKKLAKSKWIAALYRCSNGDDRLILNVSALTILAKDELRRALDGKHDWISFTPYGGYGISHAHQHRDGLKYYGEAEIILGE